MSGYGRPLPPGDLDGVELPFIPNAADDALALKAERQRAIYERKALAFWRGALGDKIGRAELWAILEEMGTFRADFSVTPVGFPDPNATFFKMGQSKYGLGLYHRFMAIDAAAMVLMHREHDPRFQRPARKRQADEND